jgi:hypothetical protein
MRALFPAVAFLGGYVVTIFVVCVRWRDHLLQDAVFTLWVPIALTLPMFAIAAFAGAIAISLRGLNSNVRVLLAGAYLATLGISLHVWFVFSRNDRRHEFLDAFGVPLLVFVNVVWAAVFFGTANTFSRRIATRETGRL